MGDLSGLTAPEPLSDGHDLAGFDCGQPSLNDWLRRRARANQVAGASRTFVVCDGPQVVGYYALAAGAVNSSSVSGRIRRNMPDPIPVVLLGRLAVDGSYHGQGFGRALFRDAVLRVRNAAESIGVRAILVQAISEDAKKFYLALGFEPSLTDPMMLLVTLADLADAE